MRLSLRKRRTKGAVQTAQQTTDLLAGFHERLPFGRAEKSQAARQFDERLKLSMGTERDAHVIEVRPGSMPAVALGQITWDRERCTPHLTSQSVQLAFLKRPRRLVTLFDQDHGPLPGFEIAIRRDNQQRETVA